MKSVSRVLLHTETSTELDKQAYKPICVFYVAYLYEAMCFLRKR
jgi:hypothetical protein